MPEKRQAPLWIDLNFAEALERFAQAEKVETVDLEHATAAKKKAEQSDAPPSLQKRGRPRKPHAT